MAWAREHSLLKEIISYNIENTLVSLDYFPLKQQQQQQIAFLLVRLQSHRHKKIVFIILF